jgi:hypothetical protein
MTDTAVQQLKAIREQWGDLLHAITVPPAPVWPPVQPSVQHLAAEDDDAPAVGRLPLTLRQHPAPLNLDALDAAMGIERGLFDLADRLAASVQVPHAACCPKHVEPEPDRWHYATDREVLLRTPTRLMSGTDPRTDRDRHMEALHGVPRVQRTKAGRGDTMPVTTAGSRTLGLHWAACWISDRLAATEPTGLHGVVRGVLRDHAERVTAQAHRTLLAALGRDERAIPASEPCPWCHGTLTTRTTSGDPDDMTITCDTGPSCTAPTPYDTDPGSRTFGRRRWAGRDQIAALMTAILHAKEPAA